jgi:hypothetical protein
VRSTPADADGRRGPLRGRRTPDPRIDGSHSSRETRWARQQRILGAAPADTLSSLNNLQGFHYRRLGDHHPDTRAVADQLAAP